MKMRQRAKLLKHWLAARVKHYATENELFAAMWERHRRVRTKLLRIDEETLLMGSKTYGRFTLEEVLAAYEDARRGPNSRMERVLHKLEVAAREAERALGPTNFRRFGASKNPLAGDDVEFDPPKMQIERSPGDLDD